MMILVIGWDVKTDSVWNWISIWKQRCLIKLFSTGGNRFFGVMDRVVIVIGELSLCMIEGGYPLWAFFGKKLV